MAQFVLLSWPIVVLAFLAFRPPLAIALSLLTGYLFLPPGTSFDLPFVPEIDKHSMAALGVAIVGAILLSGLRESRPGPQTEEPQALPGWIPRNGLLAASLALLFIAPFLTALGNSRPLVYGPTRLPGMSLYDGLSIAIGFAIMVVPFLFARRFLFSPQHHRMLVAALAVVGAGYALLALFEVRMSPQLNNWIYGFFQHSWIQHKRDGGFRPIVFLQHGLWLGIFLSICFMAAVGWMRSETGQRRAVAMATVLLLLVTLTLIKSLGALMITVVLGPVVLLAGRRLQIIAAAVLGLALITFPALRVYDLVPIEPAVRLAERIDAERAASFLFRIENEEEFLGKALEKPLVGWGGFQRARIFNEEGRNQTTNDSFWGIYFSRGGWLTYFPLTFLLFGPIVLLARRSSAEPPEYATAALGLALAANAVDMLVNGTLTPVTWLLAGALAGRLEWQASPKPISDAANTVQTSRYARATRPVATGPDEKDRPAPAMASRARKLTRFEPMHVRTRT